MREIVLGFPIDVLSREETFEVVKGWFKADIKKPKMIVTAYGMFLVNGTRDVEFAKIVKKADLVTPDGNSVLAAVEYNRRTQELKSTN